MCALNAQRWLLFLTYTFFFSLTLRCRLTTILHYYLRSSIKQSPAESANCRKYSWCGSNTIFLCPCLIYVIKSLGEPPECWAFCLFLKKKIAVEVHLQQEHNSSSTYCHKVNDISCHVKWIYLL